MPPRSFWRKHRGQNPRKPSPRDSSASRRQVGRGIKTVPRKSAPGRAFLDSGEDKYKPGKTLRKIPNSNNIARGAIHCECLLNLHLLKESRPGCIGVQYWHLQTVLPRLLGVSQSAPGEWYDLPHQGIPWDSLLGVYIIPAGLRAYKQSSRWNVFPVTLGSHGFSMEDVAAALSALG
jgi:hypothetical protein